MSYEFLGQVTRDTFQDLLEIAKEATWKEVKDDEKHFNTCYVTEDVSRIGEISERWPDLHSAFFLKIPAGGKVHKHIDKEHNWKTYHIAVTTNDDCVNYISNGQIEAYRLRAGDIYTVDRQLEHWSENYGQTDRIHLLVEAYE